MKKRILPLFGLLVILASCSSSNEEANNSQLPGTYKLTTYKSSVPLDLNQDGTVSNDLLAEMSCFAGSTITINAANTFTKVEKVQTTVNTGSGMQITCGDENGNGTWGISNNNLILRHQGFDSINTIDGNKIKSTNNNIMYPITSLSGAVTYVNTNIEVIYTKQ